MPYIAKTLALVTLVVVSASPALASRRHPRYNSPNRHQSFLGDNKGNHAEAKPLLSAYKASRWPSNTGDCLKHEVPSTSDTTWHIRDGRVYDKLCLKSLAYLVEPEERATCRAQGNCHVARGYDNDCLVNLSFDQGFSFDFEEVRRQELEWKKYACHGKTLDQCGRNHSLWWRSLFPSSRGDCRIRRRIEKEQDVNSDNWIPWSIGPDGTAYDSDCLSRFANRLGMENPGNCTQTNTYAAHNARDVPSVEVPKTLVHATNPLGPLPGLELPTTATDLNHLTATPVTAYIPPPEQSAAGIIPMPLATNIPDFQKGKRIDVPQPPVHKPTEALSAIPTSLPLVTRAQDPPTDLDEWSCMWNVDITLPDSAPRMFDAAFGDATVDNIPLAVQRILKGELEDFSECGDGLLEDKH